MFCKSKKKRYKKKLTGKAYDFSSDLWLSIFNFLLFLMVGVSIVVHILICCEWNFLPSIFNFIFFTFIPLKQLWMEKNPHWWLVFLWDWQWVKNLIWNQHTHRDLKYNVIYSTNNWLSNNALEEKKMNRKGGNSYL